MRGNRPTLYNRETMLRMGRMIPLPLWGKGFKTPYPTFQELLREGLGI